MHILNLKAVANVLGVSLGTVRNMMTRGDFPSVVKISERRVGVDAAELATWIESRKTVSNNATQ